MICPACKHDMIVVEYKKVELDYCTNCRGVWFDEGELNLFLNLAGGDAKSFTAGDFPAIESSEKIRKCPICRKKMIKSHIKECTEITIDVCPRNDGLWFDGGEVNSVVKKICASTQIKDGSQKQILDFVEQVFKAD
jgi:Zn-finger nucleic acid-binding protein